MGKTFKDIINRQRKEFNKTKNYEEDVEFEPKIPGHLRRKGRKKNTIKDVVEDEIFSSDNQFIFN